MSRLENLPPVIKPRIGFIGGGPQTVYHLERLGLRDDVTVAAVALVPRSVADPRSRPREPVAESAAASPAAAESATPVSASSAYSWLSRIVPDANVYPTPEYLLQPGVCDLVWIDSGDSQAYYWAGVALNGGLPIVVDTWYGITAQDCADLAYRAESSGTWALFVAPHRRFDDQLAAHQLVSTGQLGSLRQMNLTVGQYWPESIARSSAEAGPADDREAEDSHTADDDRSVSPGARSGTALRSPGQLVGQLRQLTWIIAQFDNLLQLVEEPVAQVMAHWIPRERPHQPIQRRTVPVTLTPLPAMPLPGTASAQAATVFDLLAVPLSRSVGLLATVEFESGLVATLDLNWATALPRLNGWSLEGDQASYCALTHYSATEDGEIVDAPFLPPGAAGDEFHDELARFLCHRAAMPATLHELARVCQLIEACALSAAGGPAK